LEVGVGINETWGDRTAVEINPFALFSEQRFHIIIAAHCQDAITSDGNG
jgi:hypothetical protein